MRARAMWFPFLLLLVAGAEAQESSLVFDTWPDGSPRTLVSIDLVYTDPRTTELRVSRVLRNGRLKRLATFDYSPRRIELLDVTGNGVPEILVMGPPGNRSAPVAILRWDGARLTQIGETSNYAAYADLNHDGVSEIVESVASEWNECGARAGRAYIQRLQDGKYESVDNPQFADVILMTKQMDGRETIIATPFLPDDFSRRCRVRISNGARGGRHRARSVELRARRLLSDEKQDPQPGKLLPLRLTDAAEYAQGTVELPTRCTLLDVTIDGPAGATIAIVVDTLD